jgi:phosphatidylserine decarboxylase
VYRAFARAVGAELDEVELPLDAYPSLSSFFSRKLREGARSIDDVEQAVTSPCDGRIGAVGEAVGGHLIQAKGKSYRLDELLADEALAADLDGGTYVTVYLSPRDYHRVHAPIDAVLVGYDYVPGSLFPVSQFFADRIDNLFSTNERVILHLETEWGRLAMVMVGAAGVGNIELRYPALESRSLRKVGRPRRVRLAEGVAVRRGDELGAFLLGSTVIAVFESDVLDIDSTVVGRPVRLGQPIASLRGSVPKGAEARE